MDSFKKRHAKRRELGSKCREGVKLISNTRIFAAQGWGEMSI
ncbi:MAG: hypothetical protein OFPII_14470 [Osedax symbiont Rs1]|nr:MAG: hypothetical protein OFPII_14470 [Osedax symbiont Rs1]